MTAVENAAVSQEELDAKAWAGFTEGNWQKDIDVRDFIQKNYTPYEGDETFLAPATEKTKHLWKYLDDNYLAVERKQRVYDVTPIPRPTSTPSRPATSTPRKSITWSLASRPTFPASAR